MKRSFYIFIGVAAMLFPWRSFAAVLTVAPSPNDPTAILVSLDTQGQNVNAIEGHFSFDTSRFSIGNVSAAGSIVNFWVSGPSFSNAAGTVDFAGVIPGGENTADGTVLTIALVPKETGASTSFVLDSAQALLNDGKGTPAALTVVNNPFPLTAGTGVAPALSTQAPNVFTPEVGRDPAIFNGEYFLVFSTTDQGSGIDHYDVLEVPAGRKVASSSVWTTASSPYLLKDQTLSSDIYVRAVDTAGNFRIEKVPALHKPPAGLLVWPGIEIFLGVIVLLLIVVGIMRRTRIWKQRKPFGDSG